MAETAEPITIAERYRVATNSGNLSVLPRATGDVDLLIAAGWSDSLGTQLYRLAGEYDTVAADVRRTAATDTTAVALILMHLKTLRETKDALGRHALQMATRKRFMEKDSTILALTGKALSAWLEPNCPKCSGRGHNGKIGQPVIICRACRGSGKSREMLGNTIDQTQFCQMLLSDMDARIHAVDAGLRRLLRAGS